MKFEAVLFDLDGTLIDSLEDLADSMNRVLRSMGFAAHPLAAYRYFVGDGVEWLVRRCLPPQQVTEELVRQGVDLMKQEYGSNWAVKSRPYDGILTMLDQLEQRGLALAVLSNKPHAMTIKVVQHFFPHRQFAAVWGARPQFAKKPSPQGALALAGELGIAPGTFLYLGDTNTDMRTAKGAGMVAIGAAWGFRTVDELIDSGADRVVRHPRELIDVVASSADAY